MGLKRPLAGAQEWLHPAPPRFCVILFQLCTLARHPPGRLGGPNSCHRSTSLGARSRRPSEHLTEAPCGLVVGMVPLVRLPNVPCSGPRCRLGSRRQESLVAQRLGGWEAGRVALRTPGPHGATRERHGAGGTGCVNLGVRLIHRVRCLPGTRRGSGSVLSVLSAGGRAERWAGVGDSPRVPGVVTSGLRWEWQDSRVRIWRSEVRQQAQHVRGPEACGRHRVECSRRGVSGGLLSHVKTVGVRSPGNVFPLVGRSV